MTSYAKFLLIFAVDSETMVFVWRITNIKLVCVCLIVAVPMLPQAEFGRNDHREYAIYFTFPVKLDFTKLLQNILFLGLSILSKMIS